jgi:hypothetical protein
MPPRFSASYVPRKRFLSLPEFEALRKVASPSIFNLVLLVTSTGMRAGELATFLAERPYPVRAGEITIRGTKTEDSARTIIVPGIFAANFVAALRGPLPTYLGNMNRDMAAACKRAGIERVTMNDLRRTFGSLLVQAGVPPHLVGKLMGHATSAMVEKVYGRQTPQALGSLVDQALKTSAGSTDNEDQEPPEESANRGAGDVDESIKSPQLYRLSYRPETDTYGSLHSASGPSVAQAHDTTRARLFRALSWRALSLTRAA